MNAKDTNAGPREIRVKVKLGQEEHRLVKIAAAVTDVGISEFVKEAAIQRARDVTKGMGLE